MVIVHYTGMESAAAAMTRLRNPAAGVSAHYLIDEAGAVAHLVDETRRAWHAGASVWGGETDLNSRSIGVELVNPGHHLGYPPFPAAQMLALERLLADLAGRWRIPPERVLGHSDIAPERKIDPGEKFDWRRLARAGLAVWLDGAPSLRTADEGERARFLAAAGAFGYGVDAASEPAVLRAFQSRFRPWEVGAPLSAGAAAQMEALAVRWPAAGLAKGVAESLV